MLDTDLATTYRLDQFNPDDELQYAIRVDQPAADHLMAYSEVFGRPWWTLYPLYRAWWAS